MYDYSSPYGESCYRLMSRTGQFIYLRTRGYLDIDRDSNQVRSFVCVNALVDEDEGKKLVREMKKKFTIMIQETEITTNEPDVPAVENPVQLERAIMSLITNLHHNTDGETDICASPETQSSNDGHESDTNRSVKSPPLEIIPPKPSTIKTSIERSRDVVSTTVKQTKTVIHQVDDKSMVKKLSKSSGQRQIIHDDNRNITSPASTSSSISSESHLNEFITIKQEQPDSYEDARVPPLPTNAGYFEMSPYNSQQFLDDVASPMESKPFDFLGFDQLQVQQADQSRYLTPETASQYQQYDTGDTASIITTPPPSGSGIKRSCSPENISSANKRRIFSSTTTITTTTTTTTNNKNGTECTDSDNLQSGYKDTLIIHQTCIDQLGDPSLGKLHFFSRISL